MDYSAANAPLWNAVVQLGILAAAMLAATFFRNKIRFVRKALMPISVLAGFLLLILKFAGILTLNTAFMEMLVYHCIALGFIALSLRIPSKEKKPADSMAFRSGALIVSTYLVQGTVGLIITLALSYTVMPSLFKAAGMLLPMGYGQGPGQANNVGGTYEALGFANGRNFGLAIAAAGYLCACIVGVVMLNLRKKAASAAVRQDEDEPVDISFFQSKEEISVSDSIDRLSIQVALVLTVYLATYLADWGLTSLISRLSPGLAATLNPLLWGFTFIIGAALAMLFRKLLEKFRAAKIIERQYQNNYLLNRISGFFFDIMITAGIASIDLADLSGLWLPFILLCVAGGITTWYWLKFLCHRLYPGYVEESLISMYGMLTGTISSGILLLREIDPNLETPAANNLVTGSSTGILFGAPVLVLIGLAAKSTSLCFLTLGLLAAYLVLLTIFLLHKPAGQKGDL